MEQSEGRDRLFRRGAGPDLSDDLAGDALRPEQIAAWRRGELVFVKTRLADVLDEINRYRPGRVVLANLSVRDKPVSGSFFINALNVALALMQRSFALNSRALPGGVLLT